VSTGITTLLSLVRCRLGVGGSTGRVGGTAGRAGTTGRIGGAAGRIGGAAGGTTGRIGRTAGGTTGRIGRSAGGMRGTTGRIRGTSRWIGGAPRRIGRTPGRIRGAAARLRVPRERLRHVHRRAIIVAHAGGENAALLGVRSGTLGIGRSGVGWTRRVRMLRIWRRVRTLAKINSHVDVFSSVLASSRR
jgi:hypothetical protein